MTPRAPLLSALGLAMCWAAAGVSAQTPDRAPATLIADSIRLDREQDTIRAEGGVEIFHEGARLRAAQVIYDGRTDRIRATGPLTLIEADGRTVILADFADLGADLQDGILRGARIVLSRRLQIATTEIERGDARHTQAYQVVASACEVCPEDPVPLWEIRARRVVHDRQERQLHFENATFRALGVPIAYLPRLRLPDPTLERATGFLAPSFRLDDELGTRLRVPYFFRLGDHADITLAPWLGGDGTSTVDLRYRQAFGNGEIAFEGAVTEDDLLPDGRRGYVLGDGRFALARDFQLDFALQSVTDRGYLTTYGFPDRDLLENFVRIGRVRRDTHLEVAVSRFTGLQSNDDNETLPTRVFHAEARHRFAPRRIGGIATISLEGGGYYRLSDIEGADGRDVARLTGAVDWRRDAILPGGLVFGVEGAVHADAYETRQGADLTGGATRLSPMAALELRYPMRRAGADGVTHVIEPVVQLAWSGTRGGAIPVEDSVVVEFDEGNLFALNRFPGQDRREEGRRVNAGLGYTRLDPLGWSVGVVGGLVLRDVDRGQFTNGSGLAGTRSDFLLTAHADRDGRWQVINRALFDETFTFASNELSVGWTGERHDVLTSLTYLEADPGEGRPIDTSEWALDANYAIADAWEAGVNWRYDFVEDKASRAELSVGYATDCVEMTFTVARRFTSSESVNPTTEFGLNVGLIGFGAQRQGRGHNRACIR